MEYGDQACTAKKKKKEIESLPYLILASWDSAWQRANGQRYVTTAGSTF